MRMVETSAASKVRVLRLMPGVEPHRPEAACAQVVAQQVHERALAAAPVSGDGERQRRLGGGVAQEVGQPERDRAEAQRVPIARFQRPVGEGQVGDGCDRRAPSAAAAVAPFRAIPAQPEARGTTTARDSGRRSRTAARRAARRPARSGRRRWYAGSCRSQPTAQPVRASVKTTDRSQAFVPLTCGRPGGARRRRCGGSCRHHPPPSRCAHR